MIRIFLISVCITMPIMAQRPPIGGAQYASLCEVAKKPSKYDGKRITVYAEYQTYHIEHSILVDENCPGEGILPHLNKNATDATELNDAIWVRDPNSLKESITAIFTGTFHFTKNPAMCMFLNKDVCRRALDITEVKDLKLTMTPRAKN